jgi:TonB family protein
LPVKPVATTVAVTSPRAPSTHPVELDIMPATSPTLLKEPTFQLYYRAIRERIRAKAYDVVPRPFQRGEIRLSFVVARSGELISLQLDALQSSPVEALRQAAMRAVREAAPFAVFPPAVSQTQIAFTIVISFEEE